MECLICNKEVSKFTFSRHLRFYHNIEPKEYYDKYLRESSDGICPTCGKGTRFISMTEGYANHCSPRCATLDKKTQEKIKSTNLEKYGYEHLFKSPEFRRQSEAKMLKIYGITHPMRSEEIKQRLKDTNKERYGAECIFSSPYYKEVIKNTNLERYGVEYPLSSLDIRNKALNTYISNIEKFEADNNCTQLTKLTERYGYSWIRDTDMPKIRNGNYVFIPNSYVSEVMSKIDPNEPVSALETSILDYIRSVYNGKIETSAKNIISNPKSGNFLELDIYIPEIKLAIECNGLYWHSYNIGTPSKYHLIKTELCIEKDIRLIHITDWEWYNKNDICKSILSSILGIYKQRIYARKCLVKEVPSGEAKSFLEINHIQGSVGSSIKLGLYYNDELVQLITLGKSRFKPDEYELLRMCTKLNTQVVGGFSKLMSHLPSYIDEVCSYIDRSKFTGKAYYSTDWEFVQNTKPGYTYYKGISKYNRIQCQKHKLKDFLGEDNFDENLSETENMLNNNYLKVYDCGNIKVKWKKER